MSPPPDRVPGPDDPSFYAPRWTRDRSRAPWREAASAPESEEADAAPLMDVEPLPEGLLRMPRSLDPTIFVDPADEPRRRSRIGPASVGLAAVAVAAGVAWLVVGWLPSGTGEPPGVPFQSRFAEGTGGNGSNAVAPVPQLVIAQPAPRTADEAFALGVSLQGAGKGTGVVLSGLPAGASLSAGRAVGMEGWELTAAELERVIVRPPQGFSTAIELLVELRQGDGTIVERRALRFEGAPKPSPQVLRHLDPDELANLIKRGEAFISTGDLASARLLLQRAAEAGDAGAALSLAGTYDPNVLEQLGVRGFAPDIAKAQAWYETAQAFGSAEAPRRLEKLASRDR